MKGQFSALAQLLMRDRNARKELHRALATGSPTIEANGQTYKLKHTSSGDMNSISDEEFDRKYPGAREQFDACMEREGLAYVRSSSGYYFVGIVQKRWEEWKASYVRMPVQNNTDEKCENCKFFGRGNYAQPGVCRRNPPSVASGGGTYWPKITKTDWCGEYKEKDPS